MWLAAVWAIQCFSALQRAENSSSAGRERTDDFSKIVSVLFSEPKIPQARALLRRALADRGFSALQRAENSSIYGDEGQQRILSAMFQCSSASRKFLNSYTTTPRAGCQAFQCSSASRKFLNITKRIVCAVGDTFQCSSASRKFLNRSAAQPYPILRRCFSALQRAENSSMVYSTGYYVHHLDVSVLFSEPKIPQFR